MFVMGMLQPLHILPWVSWHSEVLVFACVLLFVWRAVIQTRLRGPAFFFVVPTPAWSLTFLGLIVLIQWATGLLQFGGDAIVYGAYLLLCAVCMVLGFSTPETHEPAAVPLAQVLALCATCSGLIGFTQITGDWDTLTWIHPPIFQRPGGNIAQPNQLATLLLMGLCSVVYLFETRRVNSITTTLLVVLLVVSVAVTASRAGILSFLALGFWWAVKRRTIGARLHPVAGVLLSISLLVAYFGWPALNDEINQIDGVQPSSNPVAYNRWTIWPQLIQAALQRPWFGWGFGQVSKAHNSVVDAYALSEPYSYAHNVLLDLCLGIGLPLTLILLVATLAWLYRKARAAVDLTAWYCFAVAIPVMVHSLFEFPFAYAYFLAPMMFAVGILERRQGAKQLLRLPKKWCTAGILAATVMFAWSIYEYIAIEEDFRVVRLEALRYGKTPADYERPNIVLFSQLDALLHAGRIVPGPNMSAEEIELARTVALRFPWTATQNRYALTLALNGNPDEASRQLRVMRALHGEKHYFQIKQAWEELAREKYPELIDIQLPE